MCISPPFHSGVANSWHRMQKSTARRATVARAPCSPGAWQSAHPIPRDASDAEGLGM